MEPGLIPSKTPLEGLRDAGVSLIELLVVVAVLSVLAVGVSMTALRNPDQAEQDQALFQRLYDQTRALAIEGRQSRGLRVTSRGISVATQTPDGWQIGSEQRWQEAVSLVVRDQTLGAGAPQLVVFKNGQSSAFEVQFGTRGRCRSDGWTGLICE